MGFTIGIILTILAFVIVIRVVVVGTRTNPHYDLPRGYSAHLCPYCGAPSVTIVCRHCGASLR